MRGGASSLSFALAAFFFAAGFFLAAAFFDLGLAPASLAAVAAAFLGRAAFGFLPPPLAARSARSATAWSSVSSAGLMSRGTVALTLPCFT